VVEQDKPRCSAELQAFYSQLFCLRSLSRKRLKERQDKKGKEGKRAKKDRELGWSSLAGNPTREAVQQKWSQPLGWWCWPQQQSEKGCDSEPHDMGEVEEQGIG